VKKECGFSFRGKIAVKRRGREPTLVSKLVGATTGPPHEKKGKNQHDHDYSKRTADWRKPKRGKIHRPEPKG